APATATAQAPAPAKSTGIKKGKGGKHAKQAKQQAKQQQIKQQPKHPQPKPGVQREVTRPAAVHGTDEVTNLRRLRWVGLAAVPTSLMLGVTTFVSTDISAIPLFWIVPLALYLLSFILVFARWPVTWTGSPHDVMVMIQPFVLAALIFVVIQGGVGDVVVP